jgi:hypothetical protein
MSAFYLVMAILSAILVWRSIARKQIDGVIGGFSESDGPKLFRLVVIGQIAFTLYFVAEAFRALK